MATLARPETDERDCLLTFLEGYRAAVRRAAHGLTEEQARSKPAASALSLGGLVKHVALCERFWLSTILMGRPAGPAAELPWEDQHRLTEGESLADWLKKYEVIAAETAEIVLGLPGLEVDAPLPDQPWFPPDSRRTARWILMHLTTEVARHAGHADIIRETLDGRTALELVAATRAA
ncbi:DinB family protein [Kitasatospora kazusensis]